MQRVLWPFMQCSRPPTEYAAWPMLRVWIEQGDTTRWTGAATGLARRMATRWGMSERVGMVQLAPRENPYLGGSRGYAGARPFSEATAEAIDAGVRKIIGESHDEAQRLLSAHRKELDALAEALLSRETLSEQEILEVTGLPPAPALETGMRRRPPRR
jgi:cell division protease FtsH